MGVSILIEGPEGAGKSTTAALTEKYLKTHTSFPVLRVHEPGGTDLGEAVRNILLMQPELKTKMTPNAQMLLYSAARAQLMEEVVRPFLENNPHGICISDRSYPSTFALQSVDGVPTSYIKDVQKPFMDGYPDVLFYMDLPPMESIVRVRAAEQVEKRTTSWRDKVPLATYVAVRKQYQSFIAKNEIPTVSLNGYREPWINVALVCANTLNIMSEEPGAYDEALNGIRKISAGSMQTEISELYNREKLGPEDEWVAAAVLLTQQKLRDELGFSDANTLQQEMLIEWEKRGWTEGRMIRESESTFPIEHERR